MKTIVIDKSDNLVKLVSASLGSNYKCKHDLECFKDGNAALSYMRQNDCDLVLTDLKIPGVQAHKFITKSIQAHPRLKIMVYTMNRERDLVMSVLRAGATSYILSDCSAWEFGTAVKALIAGGAPMSPQISRYLLDKVQTSSIAASLSILTNREREIFQYIEDGKSYKKISAQLNISCNTVHTHLKNIYGKLQAEGKEDALSKARQLIAA